MAAATSYDLPNYIGDLFQKQERPNALLRLVGGLTGNIKIVHSTEFPMGVDYTLPSASQPSVLEGADPTSSQIATTQAQNVVQIFQEAVEFTYSRLGTTQNISGVAVIPGGANGPLINPGSPAFQTNLKVLKIARDMNYTFLRGAYVKPSDNLSARRTRGVRTAVTTNLFANGGTPRAMSKTIFENALRDAMANGMFAMGDTIFCLADQTQIGALAALYAGDTTLPESREVVGVAVRTIVTQWCNVHLVYEPDMAAGEVFLTRPEFCRVAMLEIPEHGLFFQEPLAKTGAKEKRQLYSEAGFDYRNEIFHAVIDDLS